jgi:hypothetical protein
MRAQNGIGVFVRSPGPEGNLAQFRWMQEQARQRLERTIKEGINGRGVEAMRRHLPEHRFYFGIYAPNFKRELLSICAKVRRAV